MEDNPTAEAHLQKIGNKDTGKKGGGGEDNGGGRVSVCNAASEKDGLEDSGLGNSYCPAWEIPYEREGCLKKDINSPKSRGDARKEKKTSGRAHWLMPTGDFYLPDT